MNETETARAIASGALPSPQRIGDSSLVALRISGTGLAERPALHEMVLRDPAIWLSADTLARVAGLPVVIDHPNGSVLDATEYAARSVGAILYPYIADRNGIENTAGPDLWGIGRLFLHAEQIAALPDLSTSPSVSFSKNAGNQTITLPGGETCLCEASPTLIDHVAIVTEGGGVWDKKLPNSGVRADSEGKSSMADNEGIEADKLLTMLNALADSVKSLHSRMDAVETDTKPAEDVAKKRDDAAKARRDAEHATWMREDAAQCERDDAAEAEEIGSLIHAGKPAETAADAAREARKDRAAKRRADAMKTRTVADAERERQEENARADAQHRADSVAAMFGERAPPPMSGEDTLTYRKRMLRRFVKYSPQFKDADIHAIADAATFGGIEAVVYADAAAASKDPTDLPEHVLLPITRTTESGHRITEFRGRHSFIRQLKRPSMRATAFLCRTIARPHELHPRSDPDHRRADQRHCRSRNNRRRDDAARSG